MVCVGIRHEDNRIILLMSVMKVSKIKITRDRETGSNQATGTISPRVLLLTHFLWSG